MAAEKLLDCRPMASSRTVVKPAKQFYHLRDDMIAWCAENFGEPAYYWESVKDGVPVGWTHTTDFGVITFYFISDEQVAWFKLRWGG